MASSFHTCNGIASGADLGILVGGGLTLFATPIIYLQHLFSKFHYQLGSPGGGGKPPPLPDPPVCMQQDGQEQRWQFGTVKNKIENFLLSISVL